MTFGSSVVDALHPWVDQIKVLKVVALLHPSVGGERPPEVKSVICAKKFSLFANCLSVLSWHFLTLQTAWRTRWAHPSCGCTPWIRVFILLDEDDQICWEVIKILGTCWYRPLGLWALALLHCNLRSPEYFVSWSVFSGLWSPSSPGTCSPSRSTSPGAQSLHIYPSSPECASLSHLSSSQSWCFLSEKCFLRDTYKIVKGTDIVSSGLQWIREFFS